MELLPDGAERLNGAGLQGQAERSVVSVAPLGDKPQTEYSIDFGAMQQTNKATDFRRRVRRVIVVGLEEVEYMDAVK